MTSALSVPGYPWSPSGLVNVSLSPTPSWFWITVAAQTCLSKPTVPPWSEFGSLLIGSW